VAKTVHERLATWRQLGQSSTVVVAAFGGALASGIALAAAVAVGLPLPSVELTQEAPVRWIDDDGLLKRWRLGWDRIWVLRVIIL
jgi:hypothetical protein